MEKLKDGRGEGQHARSQCPVIGQGKHWHDELSSKEWERGGGGKGANEAMGENERDSLTAQVFGQLPFSLFLLISREVSGAKRRFPLAFATVSSVHTCEVI